ncbi:oxygen-dependent tRNA uridine(34) hydroxylase TrhO [Profundibacterium mesophilum]|uniref:tRNA uridine(34) hydroxylase n=1 Tax=Profundibacterium mesophilum KAUST100406-0324 TaxID=1037889 RepID=A0A921TFF2_9RHOB|nr:rhodanese-related sulfurtransferase [Profundibacterium mesophilum]KAF0676394.1 Rhodanese-like domain containing protein [Profundibacterium mesophilum KAUST100406-0324]
MIPVVALYHFTRFDDPAALRSDLLAVCREGGVRGSLLLACEGINGTIAGPRAGLDAVLGHIRGLAGCAALEWKESSAARMPFGRMKVRLKREIVTMNEPDIDPVAGAGHHVPPAEWNALISAPDVAVIDTRNAYEVAIGSFEGALDPGTERFADFPAWWRANKARFDGKRIAMFCTGGIRCEKSTAFLRQEGVDEVFHLQGGILRYLEEIEARDSMWHGECFVFDQRVSVGQGLSPGTHGMCHGCRAPVSAADMARPEFEEGVRCHRCAPVQSPEQTARFRERQKQMRLAADRGESHLGED